MSIINDISSLVAAAAEKLLGTPKSDKDSKPAKTPAKKPSSTPIITMQEKPKTDTFNKTNPQKVQSKTPHKTKSTFKPDNQAKKQAKNSPNFSKEIKQIHSRIKKQCEENGLKAKDVIKNLENMSGINKKDYKKLSEKEKIRLWRGVETIVDEQIQIMKKYGTSAEASQEALLLQMAETYMEAQESGEIQDGKTFFDEAGDINAELGNDFHRKSKAEQKREINESYKRWQEYRQEKVNEAIENCKSEKEKAAKLKEINEYLDQIELIRYGQFLTAQNSEDGYNGIILMGPKNMGKGLRMFRATRKDDAERRRVADEIITFESELDIIKTYNDRGEKADAAAVQEFNQYGVMDKSAEKLQEFQNDYVEARKSGQYTYLEEDGIFTAMATGIGIGATVNTCMTEDEKAAFLHNWNIDAQQFDDYKDVIKAVEEGVQTYIEEHAEERPELAAEVERIREIEKTLPKGKVSMPSKSESQTASSNIYTNTHKSTQHSSNPITNTSKPDVKSETQQEKEVKTDKQVITKYSSDKHIEFALVDGSFGINEVLENLGEDKTYKIICSNPSLISRYKVYVTKYIQRQKRIDDLVALSTESSAVLPLILCYNTVENKEELREKLEKKANSVQKYLFKENEQYEVA